MLTCKQVARSLTDGDYAELPPLKRLSLKVHVLLCAVCGRYHRQVMRFQDGVRRYRKLEASRIASSGDHFRLLEEEKESIRRILASRSGRRDSGDRS